jgi:hypothetical protein
MVLVFVVVGALAGCGGGSKPNPESDFDSGDGAVSAYSGKRKSVVIPAEIGGEAVTQIDPYAFAWNDKITAVVIPEGVTAIGDFAFTNCTALKSVTLPASIKEIGDGAFLHCDTLTTAVNIPSALDEAGTPVLERMGDFAFGGCNKLDEKTRAALAELGVPDTDLALGKPQVSDADIDRVLQGLSIEKYYDPGRSIYVPYGGLMGMPTIVARNLFSQHALTNQGDAQARLVSLLNRKDGVFMGTVELSSEGEAQRDLLLLLASGTDGANLLLYTKLFFPGTDLEIEGTWTELDDAASGGMVDYEAGYQIGLALSKLVLPITEQGFYNVRRLGTKLNPGVLSPAALAKEQAK